MTGVLIRRRKWVVGTHTHTEGHARADTEAGVLVPPAKGHQRLLATTRS